MSQGQNLLTELPRGCLSIVTHRRSVRMDGSPQEVDRTYLSIDGTPEGLRWLARHLEGLAKSGEKHDLPCGNILDPADFENRPVKLDGWDAVEFGCRKVTT